MNERVNFSLLTVTRAMKGDNNMAIRESWERNLSRWRGRSFSIARGNTRGPHYWSHAFPPAWHLSCQYYARSRLQDTPQDQNLSCSSLFCVFTKCLSFTSS